MRRRLVGRSNPFVMGCKIMSTGTSKTALSAARIALLTGVSAAALFAAGSASAQGVVNPPFVTGDAYSSGIRDNPKAADITPITIPGLNVSTLPQVLVTNDVASTPIAVGTAGALNSNGTPVQKTYATEIAGGATATTGSAGSGVASYVVVNTVGGGLGNPGLTPNQLAGLAPLPAGYSWAPVASTDPTAGAAVSKWVSAVYNSNKAFTSVAYAQPNSSGQNWYVVDSNGKPVPLSTFSPYFAGLTGAQQNALNTAANIGNITAFNSNLAADGAKYQVVSGNSVDPALAASSNYTYQGVQSSPQGQGNGTVTSNQGATASTTSLAGGAVYANNKGQTTAIGPDGIYSVGGTGTWTNGALLPQNRSTTTINDGQITSFEGSNRANAGITSIDGSSVAVVNATGSTKNQWLAGYDLECRRNEFHHGQLGFVNVVGGPTANTDGVKSLQAPTPLAKSRRSDRDYG